MAGTMHTPDHATGAASVAAAISLPTALEFFGDMSPAARFVWVLTVTYTLMKMYDWWQQHKARREFRETEKRLREAAEVRWASRLPEE